MKLTRNNQLVLDALAHAGRPMGAYELIDAVRPAGITAPPTVYRALNKLIDIGMVHRVESQNAFVVCNGSHEEGGSLVMLMLCTECGKAEEFTDTAIAERIEEQASGADFSMRTVIVEAQGYCRDCRAEPGVVKG